MHLESTRGQLWLRRVLAAAVVVCMAVVLIAPAEDAQASRRHRVPHFYGYRIPNNHHASGSWIGGYRVRGRKAYEISPYRLPVATGRYGAVHRIGNLNGGHKPSRSSTARAAWILSFYGQHVTAGGAVNRSQKGIEPAAVDAAVLALLYPRKFGLKKKAARARINHARYSSYIRSYARQMIAASRGHVRPARLVVHAADVRVGGTISLTGRLYGQNGKPWAGRVVHISSPGTKALTRTTDSTGRLSASIAAPRQGMKSIRVWTTKQAQVRLSVRKPKNRRLPMMALAGRWVHLRTIRSVGVKGPQHDTLSPKTRVVAVRKLTAGVKVKIKAASRLPQTVVARVFGPHSKRPASCAGKPTKTIRLVAHGSGTYTTPPTSLGAPGYYSWRVVLKGNRANDPLTKCGATTQVKATPSISATRTSTTSGTHRQLVAVLHIKGLSSKASLKRTINAHARLYGPFRTSAAAKVCTDAHLATSAAHAVSGNGTYKVRASGVARSGWYVWRASMPAATFSYGASSACGTGSARIHIK